MSMIKKTHCLLLAWLMINLFMINIVWANDGPKPHDRLNAFQISSKIIPHVFDNMHLKITGVCVWWHCDSPFHCGFDFTLELDEYLPDLLVSVYNGRGNDPLYEMSEFPSSTLSPDEMAYQSGNILFHQTLNSTYANPPHADLGNGNSNSNKNHYDALRTKSVDVIGSPLSLFRIPAFMLRPDTSAYNPYYISDLDSLGRLGLAESLRSETWSPLGHYIGHGFLNHWSYEFPRNTTVNVYNPYKAAVIAGQRAADIVTNINTLHTNQSTSNSCGTNCVVANVIEEENEDHEIWQEIYPQNKHIHPGESDLTTTNSMGQEDEKEGRGNYIFVIWRHYQGCIQGDGHLVSATRDVGSPEKR